MGHLNQAGDQTTVTENPWGQQWVGPQWKGWRRQELTAGFSKGFIIV